MEFGKRLKGSQAIANKRVFRSGQDLRERILRIVGAVQVNPITASAGCTAPEAERPLRTETHGSMEAIRESIAYAGRFRS